MKDPLDLTPLQVRDIIQRHEEVALTILGTVGDTPTESINNLNDFIRDMSEKLIAAPNIETEISFDDRRRIAGLLNMVVCPMMIAQWKQLMRSRKPNNPEKTNDQPLA